MLRQGTEGQLLQQSVLSPHRGLSVGSWLLENRTRPAAQPASTSANSRQWQAMERIVEICVLYYRVLQELCTSMGWSLCLQSAGGKKTSFHQTRRKSCNVLALCQNFSICDMEGLEIGKVKFVESRV